VRNSSSVHIPETDEYISDNSSNHQWSVRVASVMGQSNGVDENEVEMNSDVKKEEEEMPDVEYLPAGAAPVRDDVFVSVRWCGRAGNVSGINTMIIALLQSVV